MSEGSSSGYTAGGLPYAAGSIPASPLVPQHQYIRAGPPPTRSFGDRLTFDVGVCYLGGMLSGGGVGLGIGLNKLRGAHMGTLNRTLIANQLVNAMGRTGSSTANGFAVFALTYNLARDGMKYWKRDGKDDPWNEAFGAGCAGALQGVVRLPTRAAGIGCGIAMAGVTYIFMDKLMPTIKKLPFDKL